MDNSSLKEGFGLVAAEAQASGVPCVLSSGFPLSVDVGLDLATFLTDYNSQEWADAILQVKAKKCSDKEKIQRRFKDCGLDSVENTNKIMQYYRAE